MPSDNKIGTHPAFNADAQAREQREQDWSLQDLYNPTGVWCLPTEYTVVPVDCQWYSKYAN